MLRIWLRWSWRDLRARRLQVAAIALIIAIGTGSYAGLTSMNVWRKASNDASYELTNIFDVRARLSADSLAPRGSLLAALQGLEEAAPSSSPRSASSSRPRSRPWPPTRTCSSPGS